MNSPSSFASSTDLTSNRCTAKALKTAPALMFLNLDRWCLLAPHIVETLSLMGARNA